MGVMTARRRMQENKLRSSAVAPKADVAAQQSIVDDRDEKAEAQQAAMQSQKPLNKDMNQLSKKKKP